MNAILYLFFSGLIVFSPQKDIEGNDFMIAYLVKDTPLSADCDHQPVLLISGSARILHGSKCTAINQSLIFCDLSGVFVDLSTEHVVASLPPALQGLPATNQENDGGSGGWLVRMDKVESSASKLKANFKASIDSGFSFGWQKVYTCAFDEGGVGKVKAMKFMDGGFESTQHQAVAETVMFKSSVSDISGGLAQLNLVQGTEKTVIELNCSRGICPILDFSNNIQTATCPHETHFGAFYDFSFQPSHAPIPQRFGGTVPVGDVTFNCLGVVESTAQSIFSSDEMRLFRLNTRFVVDPKPSDRIICPPVVMGQ